MQSHAHLLAQAEAAWREAIRSNAALVGTRDAVAREARVGARGAILDELDPAVIVLVQAARHWRPRRQL